MQEVRLGDERRTRQAGSNGSHNSAVDGNNVRLPRSTLRKLGKAGQLQVVGHDDPPAWFEPQVGRWYLIERGRVELARVTWSGRKLVLATLEAGEVFGGPHDEPAHAEATVAKILPGSRVYGLRHSDLARQVGQHPGLTALILEMYAARLSQYESQMEALAFHDLSARLAALLLELSTPSQGGAWLVRGFSQQELADRVGTHRETLTSLLGTFRERGWVRTDRKLVELLDVEALAGHNPGRGNWPRDGHPKRDFLGRS